MQLRALTNEEVALVSGGYRTWTIDCCHFPVFEVDMFRVTYYEVSREEQWAYDYWDGSTPFAPPD